MSEPKKQGGQGKKRQGQGGGRGSDAGGGRGGGGGQGRGKTGAAGAQNRGRGGGGGKAGAGRSGGRRSDADDKAAQLAGPLQNVLQRLPATQREVIEWRMGLKDGHPTDLADTARAMGISLSEARDIEKRAFEYLREVVPLGQLQKLLKG